MEYVSGTRGGVTGQTRRAVIDISFEPAPQLCFLPTLFYNPGTQYVRWLKVNPPHFEPSLQLKDLFQVETIMVHRIERCRDSLSATLDLASSRVEAHPTFG